MPNNHLDKVKVCQSKFGGDCVEDVRLGSSGYMVKRGENVVAFYLDAWTKTGRAYPMSTCSSVYFQDTKETKNFPSFIFEDGPEDEDEVKLGEVYFPEFEGWNVFSVTGGKTLSVCLVKEPK